ncbi:FG-GAP-like repeat-containing protein [Tunturiibacter gelidiferens]|uniref:FG-GAP-like repeat-containing protein n=1 Tax=Tunturiibacter gelidiferens TaxID=3069689 RepID=UPI003D9BD9DB
MQDFNGDGIADYASENTNSSTTPITFSVQIMLGKGDGTFMPSGSYPAASDIGTYGLAAVQSRGNGVTDLVVTYYDSTNNGSIGLMLGNGDGTFLPEVIYPFTVLYPSGGRVRVGDVTGDGLQDIVIPKINVFDNDPGSFVVFAGNGDGTYQPGVVNSLPPNTRNTTGDLFAVADFNHDGLADIAGFNPLLDGMIYVLSASSQGNATYDSNIPFTTTIYGQGVHQLVATYSGDSNYASNTSNILTQQAVKTPPPPPPPLL